MNKITWKVSDKPTGPYKSFHPRSWPHAYYEDEFPAAYIGCEDEYIPKMVKEGTHKPLTLYVADHSGERWNWRKVKVPFATLDLAKAALERVLKAHPQMIHKPLL